MPRPPLALTRRQKYSQRALDSTCYEQVREAGTMTFHQFLVETLAIFVGDVLATAFIALVVYLVWYLFKYPSFRVGASWTFTGWDVKQMGRFPNPSDSAPMTFTPSIGITSYDTSIKEVDSLCLG
jgi:hypothetical protein